MRVGIMSFAHLHALSYVHHLGHMADIELVGVADDSGAWSALCRTVRPEIF